MEILKYIKNNLSNQYYDNIIYFLDETEKDKYEEIIELLNKDYGYLDIVLDFKDYDKIKPLFEQINNNIPYDKEALKCLIISDYLNYSILKGANIENDEMGECLFGGSLNNYIQTDSILFEFEVEDSLKEIALTTKNRNARIHYLLDAVDDIDLQKCINNLFVYRTGIAMLGYTTKDLLAYYTTNRQLMERTHDYMEFDSEEKQKKLMKRWNI